MSFLWPSAYSSVVLMRRLGFVLLLSLEWAKGGALF